MPQFEGTTLAGRMEAQRFLEMPPPSAEEIQAGLEYLKGVGLDPSLVDAHQPDALAMHDTGLPATDASRARMHSLMTKSLVSSWELSMPEIENRFSILPGEPEMVAASRKERRQWAKLQASQFKHAGIHETVPLSEAWLDLENFIAQHGFLGGEIGLLMKASALNYGLEWPSATQAKRALEVVDAEDLRNLFGDAVDLNLFSLGEVAERLRAERPPDLSQETLDHRMQHIFDMAQMAMSEMITEDLKVMALFGGNRRTQAGIFIDMYHATLFGDNFAGKVAMMKSLKEMIARRVQVARSDMARVNLIKITERKYAKLIEQAEWLAAITLWPVYESLGYTMPEAFRPLGARQKPAAQRPVSAPLKKPAIPKSAEQMPHFEDELATLRTGVDALVAEWQVSAKQRKQPERDFSEFERALVNGYRNVAATATIPGISKEQAAVLTGLLMRLDGRAAAHDTRQTAQDLHAMLIRLGSLQGRAADLAKQQQGSKKGKGLELPAVPEIERAVDYMREHWQGLASLLEDKWPGALREDRLQTRQRLEAVLAAYEADENAAATQLAPAPHAPLSGVVELEGASE